MYRKFENGRPDKSAELSLSRIAEVLESKDVDSHCELFCALDIGRLKAALNPYKKEVCGLLEAYLHMLSTEKGGVVIILGDLLGEHFDLRFSAPVLFRQVASARFREGRACSLYGLYRAYLKTGKQAYADVIHDRLRHDKSAFVRSYAQWLLNRIGEVLPG